MSAAEQWKALSEPFNRLRGHVGKARTTNISAQPLREEARALAELYFKDTRPALEGALLTEQLEELDTSFQSLLVLSERANKKATYAKHLKRVHKLYPKISVQLALNKGTKAPSVISVEDLKIAETLEGLVPSAARSFKQASADLADKDRLSFRGAALEIREALRETLDYLAPDKEVMAAAGYQNEKGRDKPTMKQKVRFILKARGQKSGPPEEAATAIEEIIGGFARSVYELSNIGTHVSLERTEVQRIRRYVIAVFHDILEIT
jgi:Predicted pPIWI-associating nuclease